MEGEWREEGDGEQGGESLVKTFFPLNFSRRGRISPDIFLLFFRSTNIYPNTVFELTHVLDELVHIYVGLMTFGVEAMLCLDFLPTIFVSHVEDVQERWAPQSHRRSESSTGQRQHAPQMPQNTRAAVLMGFFSCSSQTIRITW